MKRICLIISMLALLLLSACRTAKPEPSPPVIVTNSDSVRIEYIERVRIDTVTVEIPVPAESSRQVVKDTQTNKSSENIKQVPVPYPVEKKVFIETPLSAWQKFRIHSFWFLAVALTVSLIYIFRKPLLRLLCRLRL